MNKEERKIYNKNYYKLNKKKAKSYGKNYNKLHKEEKKFYNKKYRGDRGGAKTEQRTLTNKSITWWLMGHSLPYWKRRLHKGSKGLKNLTPEYMEDLTRTQLGCCYYTGIPLRPFKLKQGKDARHLLSRQLQQVSIDKLDPKKGYVKGNVVLASSFVNHMKGQCTLNQFKSLISLISKRHNIGRKFQDESFNRIRNKIRKIHVRGVLKDRKRIQRIIGKKSMEIQRDYQESLKKKN
jgi:hypothetical protein